MSEPVSIIIPAFNQLQYCTQCIETLLVNTDRHAYRLILVDNGSDDGVGAYFDSVPDAIVVHSETNRGFAGGVNLGLAEASGHILLLNSDTLVPSNWLTRLVDALERDETVGIVGPMSNYVSGPQLIPDLELPRMEDIEAISGRLYAERRGQFVVTDRLVGFCMLIRDAAFEKAGLFDEQFGIGNYEDDDYGLRVRNAGYVLHIASDCFVFHYGSRTFAGMEFDGDRWTNLLETNERLFRTKWGMKPEFERSVKLDEALMLNQQARMSLEEGDHRLAMVLLTDAIRKCPELAENYNDLGAVLWEVGEPRRAIALFKRSLALNPSHQEARENLTAAETAMGLDAWSGDPDGGTDMVERTWWNGHGGTDMVERTWWRLRNREC